jgi:hypothetical protein
MEPVTGWTGASACVLQAALRMSNEAFAAHLGIGVRTVAGWHQKPGLRPRPEMQQLLDTAFARAAPAVRERFAALGGVSVPAEDNTTQAVSPADNGARVDAEHRLIADQNIAQALNRLDHLAGWEPGTARGEVAARLTGLERWQLLDRANRRSRIGQPTIARALGDYYQDTAGGFGRYRASCQGSEVTTSVLTHPDWLDLECPLTVGNDRLRFTNGTTDQAAALDAVAAGAAAQRLAETLAGGTRFTEAALYRLDDIDIAERRIGGSLGLARFASYALTLDLLEGELTDALAAGVTPLPGSLPLRDRYLPDVSSVLDVAGRLCAGGALALCAFARPASRHREHPDYLLLVQERSGNVINAASRLAVIPKGFHQPMTDFRSDARIEVTLLREMEEELFGRKEIDNTLTEQHAADPMHPSLLTEPMRWLLTEHPSALRVECTGFGLNLVSGNYEFPCLIVVESDEFWSRYGGQVEANWESSALRQYSSLDRDSLAELATDAAWSDEGLFALMQGLRRLRQVGGDRADIPGIEWTVSE